MKEIKFGSEVLDSSAQETMFKYLVNKIQETIKNKNIHTPYHLDVTLKTGKRYEE